MPTVNIDGWYFFTQKLEDLAWIVKIRTASITRKRKKQSISWALICLVAAIVPGDIAQSSSAGKESRCDMTEKEISKLKEDNFNNERTIEKYQRDFRVFDGKIKALEAENKELQCVNSEMQHRIDCLESDKSELRARCKESARDNFDNHLYGLLNIVGAEDLHPKFELPTEPIKVAEMLIYATETRKNCMTGKEYDKPVFDKWQLEQIARHLLVYCGNSEDGD